MKDERLPGVLFEGRPAKWDESPKGCWSPHPYSRAICQLPPDGHEVHKRLHGNKVELETWTD